MIKAEFYESDGFKKGFRVKGHAEYADKGHDIVCAAVSTAVSMAANIITDGFGIDAEVSAVDDEIDLNVEAPDEHSEAVLNILVAQLGMILEEFPDTIKITISEV